MAFGVEKLGWAKKHWLFVIAFGLAGIYLFQFTSEIVSWLVSYKLDDFPFISVKNTIGVVFMLFAILLYLNQVDYNNVKLIGWDATYWLFLITSLISSFYFFNASFILPIVTAKLEFFPLISVQNALAIILFIMTYEVYKVVRP